MAKKKKKSMRAWRLENQTETLMQYQNNKSIKKYKKK